MTTYRLDPAPAGAPPSAGRLALERMWCSMRLLLQVGSWQSWKAWASPGQVPEAGSVSASPCARSSGGVQCTGCVWAHGGARWACVRVVSPLEPSQNAPTCHTAGQYEDTCACHAPVSRGAVRPGGRPASAQLSAGGWECRCCPRWHGHPVPPGDPILPQLSEDLFCHWTLAQCWLAQDRWEPWTAQGLGGALLAEEQLHSVHAISKLGLVSRQPASSAPTQRQQQDASCTCMSRRRHARTVAWMMATERSTLVLFTSGTCRRRHVQLWYVRHHMKDAADGEQQVQSFSGGPCCMPGRCKPLVLGPHHTVCIMQYACTAQPLREAPWPCI